MDATLERYIESGTCCGVNLVVTETRHVLCPWCYREFGFPEIVVIEREDDRFRISHRNRDLGLFDREFGLFEGESSDDDMLYFTGEPGHLLVCMIDSLRAELLSGFVFDTPCPEDN